MVSSNKNLSFEEVEDEVIKLLDDEGQQFIFLTGAAGTGKSTLLQHVRNQLDKKKMVVAPTGQFFKCNQKDSF